LANGTGYTPEAVAVACGIPSGVARGLLRSKNRSQRIRAVDARELLALDVTLLLKMGKQLADTEPTHKAFMELGVWCPSVSDLADYLRIGRITAYGLLEGHLPRCERAVLWHCVALIQAIMHERRLVVSASGRIVAA